MGISRQRGRERRRGRAGEGGGAVLWVSVHRLGVAWLSIRHGQHLHLAEMHLQAINSKQQ